MTAGYNRYESISGKEKEEDTGLSGTGMLCN
jgi:hypothetical protein